jgi:hypothetical protein
MTTRREVIGMGARFGGAALLSAVPLWAGTGPGPRARLETRMFNFRADATPAVTESFLGRLRKFAAGPGAGGFKVGRNLSSTPFPSRFEWIYFLQSDERSAPNRDPALGRFRRLRGELASLCSGDVECVLDLELPPRYADAHGVKVRHTVMFDFKADASPEARKRNVAAIRSMGTLPMVQHYLVARTSVASRGSDQMEWQVIGDFASLEDYQAYSDAPVHLAIREDFTANTQLRESLEAMRRVQRCRGAVTVTGGTNII